MTQSGLAAQDGQPGMGGRRLQERLAPLASRLATLLEPVCIGTAPDGRASSHLAGPNDHWITNRSVNLLTVIWTGQHTWSASRAC